MIDFTVVYDRFIGPKFTIGGMNMSENQKVSGRGSPPSTPRWVKLFVIILIALVLIVVIAHLTGIRFDHGAGRTLSDSLASYPNLTGYATQQL